MSAGASDPGATGPPRDVCPAKHAGWLTTPARCSSSGHSVRLL
jgi:hypothetical protein